MSKDGEYLKLLWKNKCVLIVEDDVSNYLLIENIIQDTGINIVWAPNGNDAIEKCKTDHSIDIVLMDINLPDINGYETTRIIKELRNVKLLHKLRMLCKETEKRLLLWAVMIICLSLLKVNNYSC